MGETDSSKVLWWNGFQIFQSFQSGYAREARVEIDHALGLVVCKGFKGEVLPIWGVPPSNLKKAMFGDVASDPPWQRSNENGTNPSCWTRGH